MEKLLSDLRIFCLVALFYALLLALFCALKIYLGRRGKRGPFKLGDELRAVLGNKTLLCVYLALFLFSAMYAVKFVVFRVILMFVYLGVIVRLVNADLAAGGKQR